jgi:hypothetical protein
MLASFLSSHTSRDHLSTIPLAKLHREFLASLPAADRPAWGRSRFAAELGAAGCAVAVVNRVNVVVGLALAVSV